MDLWALERVFSRSSRAGRESEAGPPRLRRRGQATPTSTVGPQLVERLGKPVEELRAWGERHRSSFDSWGRWSRPGGGARRSAPVQEDPGAPRLPRPDRPASQARAPLLPPLGCRRRSSRGAQVELEPLRTLVGRARSSARPRLAPDSVAFAPRRLDRHPGPQAALRRWPFGGVDRGADHPRERVSRGACSRGWSSTTSSTSRPGASRNARSPATSTRLSWRARRPPGRRPRRAALPHGAGAGRRTSTPLDEPAPASLRPPARATGRAGVRAEQRYEAACRLLKRARPAAFRRARGGAAPNAGGRLCGRRRVSRAGGAPATPALRPVDSGLVGREAERRRLLESLEEAVRQRASGRFLVTGEHRARKGRA